MMLEHKLWLLITIILLVTLAGCDEIEEKQEAVAVSKYAQMLDEEDPEKRIEALEGLRHCDLKPYPELTKRILKMLSDENALVREAAVHSLVWVKPAEEFAIPILKGIINSDDYDAARDALKYLRYSGYRSSDVCKVVIDAFKSESNDVRIAAYDAILGIKPDLDNIMPELEVFMQGGNSNAKYVSIMVMKEYGYQYGQYNQELIDTIQELLYDSDVKVRIAASKYLTLIIYSYRNEVNIDEIAPALLANISQDDYELQDQTVSLLSAIGTPAKSILPALILRLENEDPKVRINSAVAIYRIEPGMKDIVLSTLHEIREKGSVLSRTAAISWIDYISRDNDVEISD